MTPSPTTKASVSRCLIASLATSDLHPIADASHGSDGGAAERAIDLVAQSFHVDVHDAKVAVVGLVPDVLDELRAGKRPSPVAHEVFQERELGRCQIDLRVAAVHLVGPRIQPEV